MICVSQKGIERALKCRSALRGENAIQIYAKSSFCDTADENIRLISDGESLSDIVGECFAADDCIVFFCAVGIAVRMISQYIKSKVSDPAVLCVDEGGKYCIPILSGHIGGANKMAKVLSEILNTQPIITTATDATDKFSPDIYAAENGLYMPDLAMAKTIAAASVNGEKIGIWTDEASSETSTQYNYGVMISDKAVPDIFKHTLRMYPKKLIAGIGCKKDMPKQKIESALKKVLEETGYCIEGINAIVSIELKKDETGLIELSEQLSVPFVTFSSDELKKQEEKYGKEYFSASPFVEEKTGVGCVCESAVMAYGAQDILAKKQAINGVTIAIGVM